MFDGAKIFIENSPGIGDLIVLTPILREIKKRYPRSEITVASWGTGLSFISRVPYVDRVHHISPSPMGRLRSLYRLKGMDYVVFNSCQPTLAQFARFLRVKHRAGNCKEKYFHTSLFTQPFPYTNNASAQQYIIDYFAWKIGKGLQEEFNITDYQCDVSLPGEAEKRSLQAKLKGMGLGAEEYVVFSPFGNSCLQLKEETIADVLAVLKDKGCRVVLMGRREGFDLGSLLKKFSIGEEGIYSLINKTTIPEMVDLLEGASSCIMLDSGPLHVACALRKKTAGIFTNGNMPEWKPKYHCYDICLNLACAKPCGGKEACREHGCREFSREFIRSKLDEFFGANAVDSAPKA